LVEAINGYPLVLVKVRRYWEHVGGTHGEPKKIKNSTFPFINWWYLLLISEGMDPLFV